MSKDNDKKAIAYINLQIFKKYGRAAKLVMPDHVDLLYVRNNVVHGLELKNFSINIDADHAASVQEAFARGAIGGNISLVYVDGVGKGTAVAVPHHGSKRPVLESCAELAAYEQALARRLAMPPGLWMSRIARAVFFFSPKTVERVFEEIIADYRHEMIQAEAAGRTADLHWLRVQYWGAFIKSLIVELSAGSLGKIIRALTGG